MLSTFRSLNPIALIKTISRETTAAQVASKKEAKNVKTGRALLLSAVIKSGIIFGLDKSEECINVLFGSLMEYYGQNGWLQNLTAKIVYELIEMVKENTPVLEQILDVLVHYLNLKPEKGGQKAVPVLKMPPFSPNIATLLIVFGIKKICKILGKKCKANLFREERVNEVKAFFEAVPEFTVDTVPLVLEKYINFMLSSKKSGEKLMKLWEKVILPKIEGDERGQIQRISFTILIKLFQATPRIGLDIGAQLLTKEYVKAWASHMHSSVRAPAQQLANEAETYFSDYIAREEDHDKKAEFAVQFLVNTFGPDPQQFFTPTRHSKLHKVLVSSLGEKQLEKYSKHLTNHKLHKNPPMKDWPMYAFTQITNLLAFSTVIYTITHVRA